LASGREITRIAGWLDDLVELVNVSMPQSVWWIRMIPVGWRHPE
jgi:hypothetical protein